MLARLKAVANENGAVVREGFIEAYVALLTANSVDPPPSYVQNAVFDLFDHDKNHAVDCLELVSGLSLLCAGSEEERVQAVFQAFDENGDNFISMDEMFKFLVAVFKVVLTPQVSSTIKAHADVTVGSAEDLAETTVRECFMSCDLNGDGKLSLDEFKAWFNAPKIDPAYQCSPIRTTFTGPPPMSVPTVM